MSSVNRNLVLGLAVFLGLGLIIFFLPKAVVNTRQTAEKEPEKTESPVPDMSGNHAADSVSLVRIETLKKDLKSISGKKDRTRLLEQLGEAYLKSNRYDSAGAYFEKAALLSSDPELIFKSGNAYFEGMAFASQPSKLDFLARKTREVLEKVPSNDPLSVDAQAKIAMTWVNSETPMKGILKMRDLAEKNPENEFLSYQLGMLSFQSGQFDKAISRLQKVLIMRPDFSVAYLYLGQAFQQSGKIPEAIRSLEKYRDELNDPALRNEVQQYIEQLKKPNNS